MCRLKRFLDVLRKKNVSLQTFRKVIVVAQENFLFKLLCEERRKMAMEAFPSISFPQSVHGLSGIRGGPRGPRSPLSFL